MVVGEGLLLLVGELVEGLVGEFELLAEFDQKILAALFEAALGEVEDDEGVGDYACALEGEGLQAGLGEALDDEALLIFLEVLDFALDDLDDDVVSHEGELLEVPLNLLAECCLSR